MNISDIKEYCDQNGIDYSIDGDIITVRSQQWETSEDVPDGYGILDDLLEEFEIEDDPELIWPEWYFELEIRYDS